MYYYTTNAKKLGITTYRKSNNTSIYGTDARLWWLTDPLKRNYDVFALRWEGTGTIIDASGFQNSYRANSDTPFKTTKYLYQGNNMNIGSNGVGISMNLHDQNAAERILGFYSTIQSNSSTGISTIYFTYQHCTSNTVTLAQSKDYYFSSSGLGNVVKFNSSTVASKYDGMQGLSSSNFPLFNE